MQVTPPLNERGGRGELNSIAKVHKKNDRAKFCPIKSVNQVHLSEIEVIPCVELECVRESTLSSY